MSTTWFAKLECNFHSSRKNRKAGRLGREVFVFVLCKNAERGATGSIPVEDLEDWYVAEQLQMTSAEVSAGVQACIDAELIESSDGLIRIVGWTEKYGRRPASGAERTEKWRRKRKDDDDVTNETSHVTDGQNSTTSHVTDEKPCDAGKERKEGEGGNERHAPDVTAASSHVTKPEYDPNNATQRGDLARSVWSRVSDARIRIATEFGKSPPLPFTPIGPSSHPKGFRDLSERIREEGAGAPRIADFVVESLIADARKARSIDWLSEKAFTEGGWRTAKERVPTWRTGGQPMRYGPEDDDIAVDHLPGIKRTA